MWVESVTHMHYLSYTTYLFHESSHNSLHSTRTILILLQIIMDHILYHTVIIYHGTSIGTIANW